MSLQGKLLRGLKWYKFVKALPQKGYDTFGTSFLPKDVLEDPHKMEEMTFYLDWMKTRDNKKVSKLFEKLMLLDLNGKTQRMDHLAKELLSNDLLKGKTK